MLLHPRAKALQIREGFLRLPVLARLRRLEHSPPRNSRRYIEGRLSRILDHAAENVPYYHRLKSTRLSKLADFPIIDKSVVRDNAEDFVLPATRMESCWTNYSSGSTGEPMRYLFDRHSASVIDKATYYFGMFEAGYRVSDRLGKQSNRELRDWWMKLGFMRERSIPTVGDHFQTIRELVEWGTDCLYLSPSLGTSLAMANEQSEAKLRVKVAFTSNESLLPPAKELISESFAADVCDRYGSAEFPGVAFTCPAGNYHIMPEQHVEVLDSRGEAVGPGERGRLVITTLHNTVMPLIRFDTQDLAVMGGEDDCACGRTWPYLTRIEGRLMDLLVDSNGWGITPMALSSMMKEYRRIRRVRVHQRTKGRALIQVETVDPADDPLTIPGIQEVLERYRGRVRFQVERVEAIEPGRGGKRRIVESRVRAKW